jgi:hypothetical protein
MKKNKILKIEEHEQILGAVSILNYEDLKTKTDMVYKQISDYRKWSDGEVTSSYNTVKNIITEARKTRKK